MPSTIGVPEWDGQLVKLATKRVKLAPKHVTLGLCPVHSNRQLFTVSCHLRYTAVARLCTVAFFSDIAFRFFFARRIGIYLVTELSLRGGMRACVHSVSRRTSSTSTRLFALLLFALSFFVTRGLDVVVTTFFSARKEASIKRITYVSTADLAQRPSVATNALQGTNSYNRSSLYSAVHQITKDVPLLRQGNLWPESIGMLTDAEIAAVTLAPASCVEEGPSAFRMATLFKSLGSADKNYTRLLEFMQVDTRSSNSLFGLDIHIIDLVSEHGLSIPVPSGYTASGHGRVPLSRQSRQHFGLLSSSADTLTAYNMECGLSPEQVSSWIATHPPNQNSTAPSLWYLDFHLETAFVTSIPFFKAGLLIVHDGPQESEVLSFGGQISNYMVTGAVTKMNVAVDTRSTRSRLTQVLVDRTANAGRALQASGLVPMYQPPSLQCKSAQAPHLVLDWGHPGQNYLREQDLSSPSNPSLSNGPVKEISQCLLRFPQATALNGTAIKTMTNNATFFYDPGNRGSEICRTRLRFSNPERVRHRWSVPSDLIAAFRFRDAGVLDSTSSGDNRVSCMSRNSNGIPQVPRPALSFLGDNTAVRHGYLVDSASVYFNTTTDSDPASPQAVFIHLVLVSWIELAIVAAMAILLAFMGVWGDVAEMVSLVLYAFAHQPTPPSIVAKSNSTAHDYTMCADDQHSMLADGLGGVPFMEPIQFAAVQLDGVVGPHAVVDLRLVPVSWSVMEGDNVSLGTSVSASETVVAVGGVFDRVMRSVRRLQSRKTQADRQADNVV